MAHIDQLCGEYGAYDAQLYALLRALLYALLVVPPQLIVQSDTKVTIV